MTITTTEQSARGVRFSIRLDSLEIGHVWLYFLQNDLHEHPWGLVEDLFVEEAHRGQGIGTTLMNEVVVEAKRQGCYKILATSRYGREEIHVWYERLGFTMWGKEFRMDLTHKT